MAEFKKIGTVFGDFRTTSNILNAQIEKVNLYKSKKIFEVFLISDQSISIKDVHSFEKFLTRRFMLNSSTVKIRYEYPNNIINNNVNIENGVEHVSNVNVVNVSDNKDVNSSSLNTSSNVANALSNSATNTSNSNVINTSNLNVSSNALLGNRVDIASEWENIVDYLSYRYPMTKAILQNSSVDINNNLINAKLAMPGKDFLMARGMNKVFEDTLENVYGQKYKINFSEELDSEKIQKNMNDIKNIQEQARAAIEHEIEEAKLEKMHKKEHSDEDGNGKPNSGNYSQNGAGSAARSGVPNGYNGKSGNGFGGSNGKTVASQSSISNGNAQSAGNVVPNGSIPMPDDKDIPPEEVEEEQEEITPLIYGRSANIREPLSKIIDLSVDSGRVCIEGEVLTANKDYVKFKEAIISNYTNERLLRSGKTLYMFDLYDGSSTITCKCFVDEDKLKKFKGRMKEAKALRVEGNAQFDPFAKELGVMANTVVEIAPPKKQERTDNSKVKRVELHMHTKMSQMDGMTNAKDLIKRAMKWGMKSIAITDHGVVQSFPEAHKMLGYDNPDMKIIYGVEAYLVPDKAANVTNPKGQDIDTTYCVLDLETTGISFRTEKITEIGIMKIKNGEVLEEFCSFVNPERPIPQQVIDVTHITDDMVKDAPKIDEILPKALEFIGDSVIVAHNADFDVGFLKHNCHKLGLKLENTYVDTLRLAKDLFPDYKKYKLGIIAENLGIKVDVAHRALDDVDTTVKVFNIMLDMLKEQGAKKIEDMDKVCVLEYKKKEEYKKLPSYHAIILAQNYVGLRNLYKLVSLSHLHYFYKKPRILKSLYKKYSEGLIMGSACEAGELYRAIVAGKSDEEIEEIAKDYDYLEIQPIGNNMFMVRNGTVPDTKALEDINKKIVELGEKMDKLVVATCDVHFMDPQDEIYRRILTAGMGFDDADYQAPLYLRTTEEMLDEFKYLGEEKAYEVVVTNTNKISDMCERISPISPEKCPPYINNCEETIKNIAYDKAHKLYGEELPKIVEDRLEKELNSIISNGFSVMYIIAQKLVWKSNEDGYIVGSRGSVGSSFVANMTGITEVNSLPPHYRCPKCHYSDFTDYGYGNGFDLPDKMCPKCGNRLDKDGMDIPFETFLGFNGDKEPDIDLNFSGEYQAKAHRYTEVIFGKGTTFKAGTVGTVAEKTALGYVRKYHEERGIPINTSEAARIAQGCTGIKRTTGQHPGGIIVVPKGREIYEFTPVQHPADDPNSDIITTHFDYHSIDQNLLKLDILGHDDPTVIRMLQDITGMDPTKVPLDDKATMSIFCSTEALGVTPEQIKSKVGSFGIPEFGTKFVRGMLVDTKPTTFDELIRISGLSHGTDVWLGNAQTLIEEGTVTLQESICCRDDIMIYLIKKGVPPNHSFKIMETVRKGKALKDPAKWAEYKELMKEHDVPDWYIKSCEKIKYMFPKAHAAAYVTNAFRIAWYKVHMPKAYYAAFFTIRADGFDAEVMCNGEERAKNKMREIEQKGNAATKTDQDTFSVLELIIEFYERGLNFLPVDLYKSAATKFVVENDGIRPPFNKIPKFGTVAAESLVEARKDGKFMSINDLKIRAKIGDSAVEALRSMGCLEGMSQSNQLSLFDSL